MKAKEKRIFGYLQNNLSNLNYRITKFNRPCGTLQNRSKSGGNSNFIKLSTIGSTDLFGIDI